MERQEGYYWVKYRTGYQIAYCGQGNLKPIHGGKLVWYVVGSEEQYEDSDFENINEIRIKQPRELPD
jgi:hypothetical protein